MEHDRVVFELLGHAYKQVPEAVEPAVGTFHDPPSGFLAGFFSLNFLTLGPNVVRVAERRERFAHLFGVVARVPTQTLLATGCPTGVAGSFSGGW